MFSKGLLPIPEDSDRECRDWAVARGQSTPAIREEESGERCESSGWLVYTCTVCTVYTPTVQHPVAGHNPSVTEEPPREWVGVGALWSAVRALLLIATLCKHELRAVISHLTIKVTGRTAEICPSAK